MPKKRDFFTHHHKYMLKIEKNKESGQNAKTFKVRRNKFFSIPKIIGNCIIFHGELNTNPFMTETVDWVYFK